MKATTDKQRINLSKSRKLTNNKNEKQEKQIVKNNKSDRLRSASIKSNLTSKISERKDVTNQLNRTYKKEEFKNAKIIKSLNNKTVDSKNVDYKLNSKKIERKDEIDYESDFEDFDEEDHLVDTSVDKKDENKLENEIENKASNLKRPETTQIKKLRLTTNDLIKNRAKDLLDIITLNTVEFDIANLQPIDYKEFMNNVNNQTNTKQIGIQSTDSKDIEIQLENQLNLSEKSIQTPCELHSKTTDNYGNSIDELLRLKKFLFKAESILNELIQSKLNFEINDELGKFGKLFRLDYQFNQLITFHNYNDLTTFKQSNTLIVFWYRNKPNKVLYCRERVSSSLAIDNGIYVLATQNGTILIYDLTNRNQAKSNLNLPDIKIDGVNKENLVSSCYSTLFLHENLHQSRIVKLSSFKKNENFRQQIKLASLDEQGNLLIWNLEGVKNIYLSLDCKLGKGMSPLGKFKLVISESLNLIKLFTTNERKLKSNFIFSTFEKIKNLDTSNFDYLIPMIDENQVLQILHFENNVIFKKSFKLPINLSNSISTIQSFAKLFLTASLDGTLTLFDLNVVKAIYVWKLDGLIKCDWLNVVDYYCFISLDNKNRISIYDLNQKLEEPIQIIDGDKLRIVDYAMQCSLKEHYLFIGYENEQVKRVKIENLTKTDEDDDCKLINQLKQFQ